MSRLHLSNLRQASSSVILAISNDVDMLDKLSWDWFWYVCVHIWERGKREWGRYRKEVEDRIEAFDEYSELSIAKFAEQLVKLWWERWNVWSKYWTGKHAGLLILVFELNSCKKRYSERWSLHVENDQEVSFAINHWPLIQDYRKGRARYDIVEGHISSSCWARNSMTYHLDYTWADRSMRTSPPGPGTAITMLEAFLR